MKEDKQLAIEGMTVDKEGKSGLDRRKFFRSSVGALGVLTLACNGRAVAAEEDGARPSRQEKNLSVDRSPVSSSFPTLVRVPDSVTAYGRFEKTLPEDGISLVPRGEEWTGKRILVETRIAAGTLQVTLQSPSTPIVAVHVRWREKMSSRLQVLGDAWERSYGDLGWRNIIPERVMPWYFATHDGSVACGYGVKTDACALCFWQIDQEGISLWLNVANGGSGVQLGQRQIAMATVVTHLGSSGQDPFEVVSGLCRSMSSRVSRPMYPVYGANDWNYSYGRSTAESILRDTEFIVDLSPKGDIRPFSVIDGGWSNGSAAWPSMGDLAAAIKQRTARPGIWIRPLEAPSNTDRGLLLPDARFGDKRDRARELAYDPTIPEAREKISAKMQQVVTWGYEKVKHDFSTYDLLGQWGFEMGAMPTIPGWSLNDHTRTNAEVIRDLYQLLRLQAGEPTVIDGCNTIGHLGQGYFDLQRTGDDTSGRQWERTRRMGVNTTSFRLPQNGIFYTLDADMVGITEAIPWEFNRQWLDLLAHSGTATIVAPGPPARGEKQREAIREAFGVASAGGLGARPIDWFETGTPERWLAGSGGKQRAERRYRWSGDEGASPFLGP